ncbi:glycosyltransferase family 4 protein, partial [[Ruminococcus] torques]|uniref:glycosyltransferase n=1 Tax=[Ruminococcus] torques TaxID=33039 RepID=UPI001EDD749A
TTAGTGLSIKTVEAMASGLPLIASPLAFRGMHVDPAGLGNVALAADADAFAKALHTATAAPDRPSAAERAASDTR